MTEQVRASALPRLERRFLDSLRETIEAEARSRTGLVTRSKQAEANRMSRRMQAAQRELTQAYLSLYLASTRGIDEAIQTVVEDDPTVDHDIEPDEEWTDA